MPRTIRYATDPASLFFPGRADDFFPLGRDVSEAALCAEMARLAYVKHEDPAEKARLARILSAIQFTVVDHLDSRGTQGFVADGQTREGEAIRVVAFRGTEPDDPRDLLVDSQAWSQGWQGAARVHAGFVRGLGYVQDQVTAAIEPSPARVVLTGHSLGAALATLVASRYPESRLYTFGSPRVGNAAFAALISRERHWRHVDYVDAVTTIPPAGKLFGDLFDYVHLEPAFYIDADGIVTAGLSDAAVGRLQSSAGSRGLALTEILNRFKTRNLLEGGIPLRDLTDHAPINYVAPLMGLTA